MLRFNCFFTIAACALTGLLYGCKKHDTPTVAGPVKVTVEVVGDKSSAASSRDFTGTVEAADAATVSFSVPGTITGLYVGVGQQVKKGQVIARVKSETLVNNRNIAKAALDQAQDMYNRLKKLHDANALPEVQWVDARSALDQARNAYDIANRAVADATLTAPMSGYIAEKLADAGQTVIAAQPVVKIVNLSRLQVAIPVPENEIGSFSPGTTAAITIDKVTVEGILSQKGIVADPLTRTYTVKFDLPSTTRDILPGMIASVKVNANPTADPKPVYTLPSQAVLLDTDNTLFVWVVKNGRAERRSVMANELSPGGITVTDGLVPGDSVITAGMPKVSSGTSVITK